MKAACAVLALVSPSPMVRVERQESQPGWAEGVGVRPQLAEQEALVRSAGPAQALVSTRGAVLELE